MPVYIFKVNGQPIIQLKELEIDESRYKEWQAWCRQERLKELKIVGYGEGIMVYQFDPLPQV